MATAKKRKERKKEPYFSTKISDTHKTDVKAFFLHWHKIVINHHGTVLLWIRSVLSRFEGVILVLLHFIFWWSKIGGFFGTTFLIWHKIRKGSFLQMTSWELMGKGNHGSKSFIKSRNFYTYQWRQLQKSLRWDIEKSVWNRWIIEIRIHIGWTPL